MEVLPSVKALDVFWERIVEYVKERSSTAMWWVAWMYWKTAAAAELDALLNS